MDLNYLGAGRASSGFYFQNANISNRAWDDGYGHRDRSKQHEPYKVVPQRAKANR